MRVFQAKKAMRANPPQGELAGVLGKNRVGVE